MKLNKTMFFAVTGVAMIALVTIIAEAILLWNDKDTNAALTTIAATALGGLVGFITADRLADHDEPPKL